MKLRHSVAAVLVSMFCATAALAATPPAPDPRDATIAQLTTQVQELRVVVAILTQQRAEAVAAAQDAEIRRDLAISKQPSAPMRAPAPSLPAPK